MNILMSLAIVLVTAVVTLALRVFPFLLFGRSGREVPRPIIYLGTVLPPAVMAALVVYSVKHISFSEPSRWMYEVLAIGATVLVHRIKRNTLVSIGVGTAVYMILVQGQFF